MKFKVLPELWDTKTFSSSELNPTRQLSIKDLIIIRGVPIIGSALISATDMGVLVHITIIGWRTTRTDITTDIHVRFDVSPHAFGVCDIK